jgi:hypothetical protein
MRASILLSLAACSGDPSDKPDGPPSIAFVAPTEGAVVCGDPLHVELEVRSFDLVAPGDEEGELPEGAGHVDLTLNGQVVNMTAETVFDLPAVEAGEYQLRAELVNADHSPIEPYVGVTVYFTVDEAACAR